MKRTIIFIALFLAGCAGNPSAPQSDHASPASRDAAVNEHEEDEEAGARPPTIGMTKAQVRARYGTPVNISSSSSSRGEVWTYMFNNFDGRIFIPYYGLAHHALRQRHSGVIQFNAAGRVSEFQWNESNPVGATIFR